MKAAIRELVVVQSPWTMEQMFHYSEQCWKVLLLNDKASEGNLM